jgi:putative Mg2+ transporter-C (MgtC) family protein
MLVFLDYLRELNIVSVFVRLLLAMLLGGFVGMERGRKRRAAGFRTYMLVCIGAALTMMLGQYQAAAFESSTASDISRYGAQVINGIGFLGAGTIILTGRREVKGLTTAAALWACACMGLAIGAGFYECVILGVILVFLCVRILPLLEIELRKRSRNLNLYMEFNAVQNVRQITNCLKQLGATVVDVEVEMEDQERSSAVFYLRLRRKLSHAEVLSAVFRLECIRKIDEL